MACTTSTAEVHRSSDVVCSVVVKDAYTLVFILSAFTAAADTHATLVDENNGDDNTGSSFGYTIFSSLSSDFSASTARKNEINNKLSAADNDKTKDPTIKDFLWSHATSQNVNVPSSCCTMVRGDDFASVPCANSFAELRATEYLAVRESAARISSPTNVSISSPDKTAASARDVPVTQLRRLHIARTHGEGGALIDLWCTFGCGCCALATFALALKGLDSSKVRLQDCVWVPRMARSENETLWTSFSSEAATTALIRSLKTTTSASTEGTEMLLLTPYRSAYSGVPRLYYVNLRCEDCTTEQAHISDPAPTSIGDKHFQPMSRWRLYAQGWFYMDELFRVPPAMACHREGNPSLIEAQSKPEDSSSDNARPLITVSPSVCLSVRSVRWLPEALDCTHCFPLFAVLYAAPAVSMGDPCLDTLSVCYLKESETEKRDTKNQSDNTTPLPRQVEGRVLLGPWSVRGLTLAHPSFMFATTLRLRLPESGLTNNQNPKDSKGTERRACGLHKAAMAFRRARGAVMQAPTTILGVFQRPAQEPYAASRLFRATHEHFHGALGREKRDALLPSERTGRFQEDDDNVFAFVLYGAGGEVARCALDGYPECASTVVYSEGLFQDGNFRAVERICALFPGAVSASAAGEGEHKVVVLTILAEPIRGIRGLSANAAASAARTSVTGTRSHDGAWRFSVQITQRVHVCLAGLSHSSPPLSSTRFLRSSLLSVCQISCCTACSARSNKQGISSSDSVCLLISGYAAAQEGPTDIVHEGIFTLSSGQSRIAQGGDNDVTTATAATSGVLLFPPLSANQVKSVHNFICARKASAATLARFFLLCSSLDVTKVDLLSHSPTAFLTHPVLPSAFFPADMLPVALTWVHKTIGKSSAITGNDLAMCVAQMDVVALLRSGDIIGWRCSTKAKEDANKDTNNLEGQLQVFRLGTLNYRGTTDTPSNSSTSRDLEGKFVGMLLSEGATPEDVRMEVVSTAKDKDTHGAAVLLVISIGPFVGVVRLRDGCLEHVIDVRVANTKCVSENLVPTLLTSSASVSAVQLQQLPVTTPYSSALRDGGAEGSGESFSFILTCVLTSHEAAATAVTDMNQTGEKMKRSCTGGRQKKQTMTCVVQLGILSWADVVAAQTRSPNADDAVLYELLCASSTRAHTNEDAQTTVVAAAHPFPLFAGFTPPLPIVFLRLSTAWFGEVVMSSTDVLDQITHSNAVASWSLQPASRLCPFVGWFGTAWIAREQSTDQTEGKAQMEAETASLFLCDAALLHLLWPGKHALSENAAEDSSCERFAAEDCGGQRRPFIRCLRWSCDADEEHVPTAHGNNGEENASTADTVVRQLLRQPLHVSSNPYRDVGAAKVEVVQFPYLIAGMDWTKKAAAALDFIGFTLRQVLYITSLIIPSTLLPSSSTTTSDSRALPRSLSNLVLCTLLLTEDAAAGQTSSSASKNKDAQRVHVASFLLCGVPLPCTGDGAQHTWHWIPLPAVDASHTAEENSETFSVGVTRVLPIASSSSSSMLSSSAHRTVSELPRTTTALHDDTPKESVCEFYCEGVAAAMAKNAAPSRIQSRLVIRYDRLCATLQGGSTREGNVLTHDGVESVFAYAAVDPALIYWESVSRSGKSPPGCC